MHAHARLKPRADRQRPLKRPWSSGRRRSRIHPALFNSPAIDRRAGGGTPGAHASRQSRAGLKPRA